MKNAEKYARFLAKILEFSDCTLTGIECCYCPFANGHEECCIPVTYDEWLIWLTQEEKQK